MVRFSIKNLINRNTSSPWTGQAKNIITWYVVNKVGAFKHSDPLRGQYIRTTKFVDTNTIYAGEWTVTVIEI
jgi:hypothetical protein